MLHSTAPIPVQGINQQSVVIVTTAAELETIVSNVLQMQNQALHNAVASEFASLRKTLAPNDYLTREETATLLRVNQTTLYRWEKSGVLIPAQRIGRRVLYARAEVEEMRNR